MSDSRVVATVNGYTITVRCEGTSAQYFIARKDKVGYAGEYVQVYTGKSLAYVQKMAANR